MNTLNHDRQELARDRETVVFNRMMSDFIDHHAPRDPLRRANFAADIASLMRQLQCSQAQVYGHVVAEMYARMPLTSMIFTTTKDEAIKEKPDAVNAAPAQKPNP